MSKLGPYTCGIDAAIDVVGGKWKALILWELSEQTMRYNALRRAMPGVSQKMLTQHLKELIGHGVVRRESLDGPLPAVEYSLTPAGRTLSQRLSLLGEWAVENIDTIVGGSAAVEPADVAALRA